MTTALATMYTRHFTDVLSPLADSLRALIVDHLKGEPRIDRVSARAKSPERFVAKAARVDVHGALKYSNPLDQIQDQIGVRVIVYFKSDAVRVGAVLKRYLRHVEQKTLVPESEWMFGYFGIHYIFALPAEAVPSEIDSGACPRLFELQIKTLFQHAWSEANHDLGYKPVDQLTDDQKRRLAYTSAQAWGADRTFQELWSEIVEPATPPT